MVGGFTPLADDVDSLIEPIVVLSSRFPDTQQEQIPDYFWPVTGKWRMRGKRNFPMTLCTSCHDLRLIPLRPSQGIYR